MSKKTILYFTLWFLIGCVEPIPTGITPTVIITPTAIASPTALADELTDTISPMPVPTPLGGGTGQIAYLKSLANFETSDIYLMKSDGTSIVEWVTARKARVLAWAPDGNQLAFTSDSDGQIYVATPQGNLQEITNMPGAHGWVTWSPDSTRLAFWSTPDNLRMDIFIVNSDGSRLKKLYEQPQELKTAPVWSPDGTQIAFIAQDGDEYKLLVVNPDSLEVQNLYAWQDKDLQHVLQLGLDWSPDSSQLVFNAPKEEAEDALHLFIVERDGSNLTMLTDVFGTFDMVPRWSSDGTKIAFVRVAEPVTSRIYAIDLATNRNTLLSEPFMDLFSLEPPSWSPDGQWVLFSAYDTISLGQALYMAKADGSEINKLTDDQRMSFSEGVWRP